MVMEDVLVVIDGVHDENMRDDIDIVGDSSTCV